MCRDLKAKQPLAKVLKGVQESTVDSYNGTGDEEDFRGLLDPPDIVGKKDRPETTVLRIPRFCPRYSQRRSLRMQLPPSFN